MDVTPNLVILNLDFIRHENRQLVAFFCMRIKMIEHGMLWPFGCPVCVCLHAHLHMSAFTSACMWVQVHVSMAMCLPVCMSECVSVYTILYYILFVLFGVFLLPPGKRIYERYKVMPSLVISSSLWAMLLMCWHAYWSPFIYPFLHIMFLCLFSVQFRTTPMDNTGVPHILEHTVLCGSRRYPCRDPFFKMLNRSLSTFMNAFTGTDYTQCVSECVYEVPLQQYFLR